MPMLKPITTNKYTIKDSFSFAEEFLNYDANLIMTSFDVESLYGNIPPHENTDFCADILCQFKTGIDGLTKKYFPYDNTLIFSCNNQYY